MIVAVDCVHFRAADPADRLGLRQVLATLQQFGTAPLKLVLHFHLGGQVYGRPAKALETPITAKERSAVRHKVANVAVGIPGAVIEVAKRSVRVEVREELRPVGILLGFDLGDIPYGLAQNVFLDRSIFSDHPAANRHDAMVGIRFPDPVADQLSDFPEPRTRCRTRLTGAGNVPHSNMDLWGHRNPASQTHTRLPDFSRGAPRPIFRYRPRRTRGRLAASPPILEFFRVDGGHGHGSMAPAEMGSNSVQRDLAAVP